MLSSVLVLAFLLRLGLSLENGLSRTPGKFLYDRKYRLLTIFVQPWDTTRIMPSREMSVLVSSWSQLIPDL